MLLKPNDLFYYSFDSYFLQETRYSESDTQESGQLLQPVQCFQLIVVNSKNKCGSKKDKG